MQVLIFKVSSMGDMIHTLPALTDAAAAIPDIRFDWVAEEAFVEVPGWHKSVNQVIPIALRRWRKNWYQAFKNNEVQNFLQRLRSKQYDLVIDAQASIKSAIVSSFAQGTRCGMNAKSVREHFAQLAYHKKFNVPRQQHAIKRLRQLFAQALNYPYMENQPNYAIDINLLPAAPIELPKRYVVAIHNTSWESKQWPEAYWETLLKKLVDVGMPVLLPWGNNKELERAQRLAKLSSQIIVLPKLRLGEAARVLAHAKAAICCDTGLAHLTAALNIPAITLYGPTNPALIGTVGLNQIHLATDANFPCCHQRICTYQGACEQRPACFTTIPPEKVWHELSALLDN